MRLLSSPEFSIRPASPYSETEPATSELLINGKRSGRFVRGAVLEAAVQWEGYRIAFLTDDVPFEEMLRIYMFDADMALVDAAMLGAMYSTGTFAELVLQPPNMLTFRFFGDIVWRIVLLAEREFAVPFFSDPSGVTRKLKFSRHFRIKGKPQPEGTRVVASHTEAITRRRKHGAGIP